MAVHTHAQAQILFSGYAVYEAAQPDWKKHKRQTTVTSIY